MATGDLFENVRQAAVHKPIWYTLIACTAAATLGHGLIWLSWAIDWTKYIPWQPVAGIALVITSLTSYAGFYVATRRARIAIASSFLVTFLVLLSYTVALQPLADVTQGNAHEIVSDFRGIVKTVIAFYFGSEALVSTAKVIASRKTARDASDIKRSDADLVLPAREDESDSSFEPKIDSRSSS